MYKSAVAIKLASDICGLIAKDVYEQIKEGFTKRSLKDEIEICIGNLYAKSKFIRKVKTLWQMDKAVDIKSFYCDTYVVKDKKRKIVNLYSDFGIDGHVLIEGIAGQGKSIFLRHVLTKEIENGVYVPLFLELRKIRDGQSMYDYIISSLNNLGFTVSQEVFKILCATQRILLLLDGFDEIKLDKQKNMISEIEDIISLYDGIKVIITSRPNSGLEYSPFFQVVKLSYLDANEYKLIINKLIDDEVASSHLIQQVERHKGKMSGLLSTPLMVTLLIITYKSYQKIPDSMSEFYDSIFQLLLQRHDGVKPGFIRKRKCYVNDTQYRQVFEGLCLYSNVDKSIYTHDQLIEYTGKALKITGVTADPHNYLNDIVKITCLILEEGEEYRFIHKSLREFYAASFLRRQNDTNARKFYEKMLSNEYSKWKQEIMYLKEIDTYRYNKYFFLPLLYKMMDVGEENFSIDEMKKSEKWMGILRDAFKLEASQRTSGKFKNIRSTGIHDRFGLLTGKDVNNIFIVIDKFDKYIFKEASQGEKDSEFNINLWDYIFDSSLNKNKELEIASLEWLSSVYSKIHKKAYAVKSFIEEEDRKMDNIDIFN